MRSRRLGALIGGVLGVAIAFGITFYLYRKDPENVSWMTRIIVCLIVGAIGALLGSIFGVSRE
jgi:high-affinity K+ transport system ATPase subunit B